MDEKIVDRAVKSAMEVYCGDDHSFVEIVCRAACEAYEAALADAGMVIVPMRPEEDRIKSGVSALLDFDRRFERQESAVLCIYEAMTGLSY